MGIKRELTLPVTVDVTWRRLDSDGRSIEIEMFGGSLLFREGAWGAYINDDAAFRWVELPSLKLGIPFAVHLVQYADRIEVSIDGRPLPAIRYAAPYRTGSFGIAAKSSPGVRSRIELQKLIVQGS
jgi:hypothetical protein